MGKRGATESADDRAYAQTINHAFGPRWARHAGHARVWSFLLVEIPKQLHTHQTARLDALRSRIVDLEDHFPDDPRLPTLRAQLDPSADVRCDLVEGTVDKCTVASLMKALGDWSTEREARVDFALCRNGELKIRCVETTPERPKLPAYPRAPRSTNDAKEIAASLVRAALSLLDETKG